jgi:uncharacterized protein (DUF2249 family)
MNVTSTDTPVELDVRPIFARGESPCQAIDDAATRVAVGQTLVLLVPFEPIPLYTKLGKAGFTAQPTQQADGTWRIEFRRAAAGDPAGIEPCGCSH